MTTAYIATHRARPREHYELSEVLYLAIVGELPNAAQATRFRVR